jgi:hypothetical protein
VYEFTARNPHGAVTRGDVKGKEISVDTIQCCHCGGHFEIVKGSGKRRGFCLGCQSMTCGSSECDPHIPFEAKLDHAAGIRTSFTTAILELERKAEALRRFNGVHCS